MPDDETIVALSTPAGEAALAVVRLSGPDCGRLACEVFGLETTPPARRANFGNYRLVNGERLDACVYTLFAAGASFTGEGMLELSPHGNPLIVQLMLEDLVARGCRPAEAGEFTRTAFLNGRLDLTQAEAVADLIHARSERSLEAARRQLHGAVGRRVAELTDRLLGIMAQVEAYIDFPEEDLPPEDAAGPAADLTALLREIRELIETRRFAALLHEGVKTLIVGAPNAGKSSLINALTGTERAIVSPQPGTTRDYIADYLMLGPHRIQLLDTAGLHEAADALERIGIDHTLEQCATADCFLLVVDASLPSPVLPPVLLGRMTADNTLVINNKADLPPAPADAFLPEFRQVRTSLLDGVGVDSLRAEWQALVEGLMRGYDESGIAVNARHAGALAAALEAGEAAGAKMAAAEPAELVAADLRCCAEAMGEVVGRIDNEAMLDQLFSNFCIGK